MAVWSLFLAGAERLIPGAPGRAGARFLVPILGEKRLTWARAMAVRDGFVSAVSGVGGGIPIRGGYGELSRLRLGTLRIGPG